MLIAGVGVGAFLAGRAAAPPRRSQGSERSVTLPPVSTLVTTSTSPGNTTTSTTAQKVTTTHLSTTTTTSALPAVLWDAGSAAQGAEVRPSEIVWSASLYVTGIEWSDWTATEALGYGTIHIDDCEPTCVAGKFHTEPTSVELTRPSETANGLLFRYVAFGADSFYAHFF